MRESFQGTLQSLCNTILPASLPPTPPPEKSFHRRSSKDALLNVITLFNQGNGRWTGALSQGCFQAT